MPSWLPLLLGVLTAVGPMSTDMYLPAFPEIDRTLGGPGGAQITLATWFAGLALGQITQGTLSDRFGRRGPLILGMGLYAIGSAGCALSGSLLALSSFRFLAALGGSAGMVIPRAVVRDLADGQAAVRLMSRLMLVMGVTPILAPSLGGFLLSLGLGWHAIFWAAALYGAICAGLVWRALPDTLPPSRRVRLGPAGLLHRFGLILGDGGFLCNAAVGGCVTFAMFAYVGGSPPVFIGIYGLTPSRYGLLFGVTASCYILASQVNARAVGRLGLSRTMNLAALAFLATAALSCLMAWLRVRSFLPLLLPLTAMWASLGFLSPNAAISALSRHARRAASASSLMGTMQFVLGAASSLAIGGLADGTARPMTGLLLLGAVGATGANAMRLRLGRAAQARRMSARERADVAAGAPGVDELA